MIADMAWFAGFIFGCYTLFTLGERRGRREVLNAYIRTEQKITCLVHFDALCPTDLVKEGRSIETRHTFSMSMDLPFVPYPTMTLTLNGDDGPCLQVEHINMSMDAEDGDVVNVYLHHLHVPISDWFDFEKSLLLAGFSEVECAEEESSHEHHH